MTKLAIVYSPMTIARVRKAPDRSETRMFGRITWTRMRPQPEPMLWAASVSVRTSIVLRPVSTARYMYGSESTVYAATSRRSLPNETLVRWNGAPEYERIRPKARITGGMTNGISVTNSTNG